MQENSKPCLETHKYVQILTNYSRAPSKTKYFARSSQLLNDLVLQPKMSKAQHHDQDFGALDQAQNNTASASSSAAQSYFVTHINSPHTKRRNTTSFIT